MDELHIQLDDLQPLLQLISRERLMDFSVYNKQMLLRRIQLRLMKCGQANITSYLAYLNDNPVEIDLLLNTILINVSHFFRNILTFACLRERVIPALVANAPSGGLRIWCAGCAQGEEAYSVAILLNDWCRRESIKLPIFIIATDIDDEALAWGRRGWYQNDALEEVRKGYLDRHFIPTGSGFRVTEEIRSMVSFVRHDLNSGTPPREGVFSEYQMILCRNVLIYFTREQSARMQRQLVGALTPGGYILLGEAEGLLPSLTGPLREVLPASKIFRNGAHNA